MTTHKSFIALACLTIGLLTGVGTAWAAAAFGTITGPTWYGSGYQWTVEVTSISNPDKIVCLEYVATPPGPPATGIACSCTAPACNAVSALGTWECMLPNIPNATIDWEIGTYSSGGAGLCGDQKTLAASGSFETGPLDVGLSKFGVGEGNKNALILATVLALGLGIVFARRKTASVSA